MQAIANRPDNAVVNVPLSRRGDIDSQLDRYKEQQRKQQRAKANADAAQAKDDKAAAKELFAKHGELAILQTLERLGKVGHKKTEKEARKALDSLIKWQPGKARRLLETIAAKVAAQ